MRIRSDDDVTGFHMSLLRNKLVAASLSAFVELHALTLRKIAHIGVHFRHTLRWTRRGMVHDLDHALSVAHL